MNFTPIGLSRSITRAALVAVMSLGAFVPRVTAIHATQHSPGSIDGGGGGGKGYSKNVLRLGDLVWFDTNNDGKHTSDEPGLPNIMVELYSEGQTPGTDAPLAKTTTDEDGYYVFSYLAAGHYFIYLPQLPSPQLQVTTLDPDATNGKNGRNRGTQAGGVGQSVKSIVFNLQPGQGPTNDGDGNNGYLIVDIGLWCPPAQNGGTLQLGDQVFRDNNNNGIRDGDEGGVNGVTIELFREGQTPGVDQPLATDITKQGGYYTFHNLSAGRYFIYIPYTPRECSSVSSRTFDIDDGKNNRNRGYQNSNGAIKSIVMNLDANDGVTDDGDIAGGNLTLDIGLVCVRLAQLGDKVFDDSNGNGLQDFGELGIPNAMVKLLDGAGNVLQETTTDENGIYQFTGLTPGATYKVMVTLPDGYVFTNKTGNLNDSNNSDIDPTTGMTDPLTLADGEVNNNVDAGAYLPVRIGNFVWRDLNGNGIYDDGAPNVVGVQGVTVRLYNAVNNSLVATTATDANGIYGFSGLRPGNYYVIFDLATIPAGLMATTPNVGSDDTIDSDANVTTGRTANTGVIVSGGEDLTVDMGLKVLPVATTTPTPVNTPTNTPVGPTNTPTNTPVGPTNTPTNTPVGPTNTPTNTPVGPTNTPTNTPTPSNTPVGPTNTPTPTPTGTVQTLTLGDKVFEDFNHNGLQDVGEPGIGGVTVTLQTPNSVVIAVTDGNGFYQFTGLVANVPYTVTFTRPNGYQATIKSGAVNDVFNSDADPITGAVNGVVLIANNPNVDAGFWRPASLGNFVWEDRNGNGVQEPGEPGIVGATVRLLNAAGTVISSTITNGNGFYQFTDLPKGDYIVEFVAPSGFAPTTKLNNTGNDASDSDADRTTGRTGTISLNPGDNDTTNDAGFYRPVSIGDRLWNDRNKNGIQDIGEPGLQGSRVTLYDVDGNAVATTVTDSSGLYQFTNLPPGRYSVGFETPRGGFVFTTQFQGTNTGEDSNVDPTTGRTPLVTLASGDNNATIDAGAYVPEPDAVTLSSFTAYSDKAGVTVKWVTTSEINSLGFRLRRATLSPTGGSVSLPDLHASSVIVSPNMILARGRGQGGASYEFVDTSAKHGARYVYWLIETELDDNELEYGPTAPTGSGPTRIFLPLLANSAKKK